MSTTSGGFLAGVVGARARRGRRFHALLVSVVHLSLLILVGACSVEDLLGLRLLPPAAANLPRLVEIQYGLTFAQPDGEPLRLDLYRPVVRFGPRPLVVVVFGGSWVGGSRDQLQEFAYDLAANGYIAAAIDYRLVNRDTVFPAPVSDVLAAIRFCRENAADLGIDPNRVATFGASAGAHLALLAGMAGDVSTFDPSLAPGQSAGVRAVVNLFGPTDLAPDPLDVSPQAVRRIERLIGADLESSLDIRIAASPISYVRTTGPAVFTVHGDTDEFVPVSQARALDAAMGSVGQKHVYLEIPGMGHGIGAIWIGPYALAFRSELLRFFAENL